MCFYGEWLMLKCCIGSLKYLNIVIINYLGGSLVNIPCETFFGVAHFPATVLPLTNTCFYV